MDPEDADRRMCSFEKLLTADHSDIRKCSFFRLVKTEKGRSSGVKIGRYYKRP